MLPPLPEDWRLVEHAALADGSLATLASNAAGGEIRLWTFDGHVQSEGIDVPFYPRCGRFDRFPDGRWLVANARGSDDNGRVLGADGQELRRIRLGDGLWHLKIDDAGRIWVGWFDEGVFGNDGWTYPGREWPPSSHGLAAFDEFGSVVAEANEGPHHGIADCYSLNVTGETAWACTYADFPIVSLTVNRQPRWWTTALSGVRAVAVEPPYVLAAGGYQENNNRAVLLRLDEHTAETVDEWRLPFDPMSRSIDFFDARGDLLSVVEAGVWRRWRVRDFLADAGGR
jgi:hypothetical protein